ncbi:alpha/beta fold hydrolase [Streptomyces sp. NPDC090112]|uniref:alpha/beta fold hydrolase n=1 Tax=Streptomyces sp. NPDC090112 TaxID=3365949 RepID=UPI0038164960
MSPSSSEPAGRFVRVDGVPLHVVVEGRGPVCVLAAGLAMAWFDWDEAAALLVAQGRTVVRFDRPGHGLSGPAAEPPTTAGEAHRIAALLDALEASGVLDTSGTQEAVGAPEAVGPAGARAATASGPASASASAPASASGSAAAASASGSAPAAPAAVTLVGHSIAAFHVEAFARLYPQRTAALVLLDASVEENPRTVLPRALRTGIARAAGRALTAAGLPAALGPAARRATVRASRTGGGDPAPADLVRRCYRTGRVWRGALLENSRYPDMAAELLDLRRSAPLTAPTTVLAGHDGSAGRGALHWLSRQADLADLLGARFEVAEPAGHLVMLDRPDQVARTVLDAGLPQSPVPDGGAGRAARPGQRLA